MALNNLYAQQSSGGSTKTEKYDPVLFMKIGDKVIGVITEVGDAWDKPKNPKFYKDNDPEWKKVQKTQKVNLKTADGMRSLYLSGRMFPAMGEALVDAGQDDLVGLEGWTLAFKLEDVDLQNKNAKIWKVKLVPPAN